MVDAVGVVVIFRVEIERSGSMVVQIPFQCSQVLNHVSISHKD